MRRALARLCSAALAWMVVNTAAVAADAGVPGEALYRQGLRSDGRAVSATRVAGGSLQGQAAACVNCHQRSGLGGREGRIAVPPITGAYLFRGPPTPGGGDGAELPYVDGIRGDRPAYTDATLARALREGIDAKGLQLGDLMPRYQIDDAEMSVLIGYLRGLNRPREPGVTGTHLHFATIVSPEASPAAKRAMLDVMQHFVEERNARQMAPVPAMKTSAHTSYARSMFRVNRKWVLHVWELTGAPATWQAQLERRLAEEPVFAIVSGLGGREWAPVHAFCERSAVPCLFPNVEVPPPEADRDFYSLYFSRGVLLEADLAAHALMESQPAGRPQRVLQVYREGDVGEAAAKGLQAALEGSAHQLTARVIPRDAAPQAVAAALTPALDGSALADAIVLWLRPGDIDALRAMPMPSMPVLLSGQMAGLEQAPVPAEWRAAVRMLYPVDLPQKRRVRVDYAMGWMSANHIPITSPRVQADTYLVMGLLSETLQHMTDAFVRDYLVERFQNTLDHRIITGFYPRLSLAPGQRFASKGGRIVRFDPRAPGAAVVPETDWTIP